MYMNVAVMQLHVVLKSSDYKTGKCKSRKQNKTINPQAQKVPDTVYDSVQLSLVIYTTKPQ